MTITSIPVFKKRCEEIKLRDLDLKRKFRKIPKKDKKLREQQETKLAYLWEAEEKYIEGEDSDKNFKKDIWKPFVFLTKTWVQALKDHPYDEHLFRQVQVVNEQIWKRLDKASVLEVQRLITLWAEFKPLTSGKTLICEDHYTHVKERSRGADRAWSRGVGLMKDSLTQFPGEFDMVSMYLGDGADHMHLGTCLLEGDPKKIDDATFMDTASRELIDDQTWNFLQSLEDEEYGLNHALLDAHQEAKKLHRMVQRAGASLTSDAKPDRRQKRL